MPSAQGFDNEEFFEAVAARRRDLKLSWPALARVIWEQSDVLNQKRNDHPISPVTIRKIGDRGGVSCQHALFLLRWLRVPPEKFIAGPKPGTTGIELPAASDSQRLRWNLRQLYSVLNAARTISGATWQQTADTLCCTPSQLSGLRTAKFATSMSLAMRITQALRRPAADFVYPADW